MCQVPFSVAGLAGRRRLTAFHGSLSATVATCLDSDPRTAFRYRTTATPEPGYNAQGVRCSTRISMLTDALMGRPPGSPCESRDETA